MQDDEENDSSNVSSDAQETGCNYFVDPGPNFDVMQVFQNPQAIGFLRALMTHPAPRNLQSSQSSYTATSQGVISPQDENPPNPDRNDSTVLQAADDSSTETEYLENLTQEYERFEKRGAPISSEKLQKLTQDLSWGIYRTERNYQVIEAISPPENIEGLEVNKVNIKVWRKLFHSAKHSDI